MIEAIFACAVGFVVGRAYQKYNINWGIIDKIKALISKIKNKS
jgi:hypothetical protein